MTRILFSVVLMALLACSTSCKTAYYGTMEKMGVHKRDIMVDRVKDARNAQGEAKEQFKDALEQFTSVLNFKGGDLEARYDKLSKAYDRSQAKANAVNSRIHSIESVSEDLFKEWKKEIGEYTNDKLRSESQRQYTETNKKYKQLMVSMKSAAAKMDPVLHAFNDQVLFLKHNLNSRAIASIQSEATQIKSDVARLIKDMEASIAEADAFVSEMGVL